MNRKKIPPVPELYNQISKNKLHKNTAFTYELWYSRFLGRRFSIFLTWALLHTNVTPNAITLFCMIPAVAGLLIMAYPSIAAALIGFFIFHIYIVADSSDGEIARFRKQTSIFGTYLDSILHIVIYSALYISLGLNIYLRTSSHWFLILGCFTALLYSIASFIHHNDPVTKEKSYLELRHEDNKLFFYAINVYNFLTGDFNIALALLILAPLQYLNILQFDIFKLILWMNFILVLLGGIIFNLYKKIKIAI
ncbi:MAG: CDP-alcohol phosphatidyltransferase family protein [Candidatus Woesebacteria bacterium]|jgi:phosphatidylglycerophosphate synthase